jgi:ubiquitin C-terminal hydrolase
MINKFKEMNLKNAFNFNNTMNNNNLMNYIYLNQMNYANAYGFNNQNINQMNLNNNINYYLGSQNAKVIEQKNSPIYPHKTGLQNVGQTCYMNSTIQCLSNIKYLSDYLIKHYGKYENSDIKNKPLSVAFSSLVYDLFTTKQKYIAPNFFKKIIGKLNPLFEGNHAADAKDLIFFLLETLHKELNKKDNIPEQSNIDYVQLEKDSFFEQKMLEHFIKDYTEKNRSIISDTFYGIIRSTMMCNACNQIKYSFQTFNLLIFQLKNVKEYNQKTFKNNNNYKINIYDAFDCDKKEEILDGENMIYCNSCKKLNPGTHQQILYSLPKVLIIILNRGRNNQDFNEEFIFPPELDLSIENYVVANNNPNCNTHFYLQSVITHLGESGAGGHFIAFCRNGPKEDFLCYNDAVVSKATVNDAMSSNISENVYEKRTPYILVYHHIN